jgi:hypothetical protein
VPAPGIPQHHQRARTAALERPVQRGVEGDFFVTIGGGWAACGVVLASIITLRSRLAPKRTRGFLRDSLHLARLQGHQGHCHPNFRIVRLKEHFTQRHRDQEKLEKAKKEYYFTSVVFSVVTAFHYLPVIVHGGAAAQKLDDDPLA